ncbi:MAG: class I SAM-dependent methyltransferase [Opitutales bacterium]|jgi:23S rRNA (cytosine1962-C5)-methyltransferase|nr:class I SAM-dependent methyltransferase [Opitutales bacterium]MDP4644552.1 class I SAM-dependent methyltransferase [Opitutales bacterium]MDP4777351.1 class I SAM-dependent methyltransferase [Opitutales bacterium]MDP4883904.1 class I SAM-dependent methyltransferase [Opitutales bacterium]MDP5079494.1 class I SAM-dependent methyltransferase [Opitutales bacterium]
MNEYALIDSGHGRKLERFGEITLDRPCAQAVWSPARPQLWKDADASFTRKDGLQWKGREQLPDVWHATVNDIKMKLSTTDFGHLGVFPETRDMWDWITSTLAAEAPKRKEPLKFLNLFAYSGGATLAGARSGAHCCHVDASKGMVQWARQNAELNNLSDHPIRWIVDDCNKFLQREIKRGNRYDGILLDPPSFGRGKGGELYKIEQALLDTLKLVKGVLSDKPSFVYLTSHTPGFTPIVLNNLLRQLISGGKVEDGEMLLTGEPEALPVPSGTWARWTSK